MQHDGCGEVFAEFLHAFAQGGKCIALRRLHFDGSDIVSGGEPAFSGEEVYLHAVAGVVAAGVAVEIELVVVCGEHLRHDILHNHALIHFQLVEKQFLIEFHGDLTVFIESMGDE